MYKLKKHEELIKKIFPILLDYDYDTIKKAASFLLENADILKECFRNVNSVISGGNLKEGKLEKDKNNKARLNSRINTLCKNAVPEVGIILKKIYSEICASKISLNELNDFWDKELSYPAYGKSTYKTKDQYLFELFSILVNEPIEKLQVLHANLELCISKKSSPNNLANWSSLIIKEKPAELVKEKYPIDQKEDSELNHEKN